MMAELTVPDSGIDREFIRRIMMAVSWEEPVAQNAIYQSLHWAYIRIGDLEEQLAMIVRSAQDCIDGR